MSVTSSKHEETVLSCYLKLITKQKQLNLCNAYLCLMQEKKQHIIFSTANSLVCR